MLAVGHDLYTQPNRRLAVMGELCAKLKHRHSGVMGVRDTNSAGFTERVWRIDNSGEWRMRRGRTPKRVIMEVG